MSKYTTQVRWICEHHAGESSFKGARKIDETIEKAVPYIFDFDFPIFNEEYRKHLCKKILRHYYTREIGAETIGLWQLWLCDRLNMIMPYYNQMYESALLTFNPFNDIDLVRERTEEGDSNNTNLNKFNDTPQGRLTELIEGTYLTNATHNEGDNEYNTHFIETLKGKAGARDYSTLLREFRKTFLNIDRQVIEELADLFMLVY